MRRRTKRPKEQKNTGLERIRILFEQAEKAFQKNPELARRYVQLARKIGMRYNIKIPKEFKRKFCKKCYSYLKPGINLRIRTNRKQKAVIMICLECRHIMRYPYRKEKKTI